MSQQLSPVREPVRDVPARGRRSVPAQWIVAGVMLGLAFLPLLYAHGQFLWIQPHYQFFPLVLAGAAALAWPCLLYTSPSPRD